MSKLALRGAGCLLIMLLACAINPGQARYDLNPDACDQHTKADAELNRVYQRILVEYKKDSLFIQKLRAAQRAWIAYRDALLESLYPAPNKRGSDGNVYPVCRCLALLDLTTRRTDELRRWLDGAEEGDVCSGSVKIRN